MFTLNADQLRELGRGLGGVALGVGNARADQAWRELIAAIEAAAKAHPECPCCKGYGIIELPDRHAGPDDSDTEELVCPVCRPWPQGFPGVRDGRRGIGAALMEDGGWVIPPYGPGESTAVYRGKPVPLRSEDGAPVLTPSEF